MSAIDFQACCKIHLSSATSLLACSVFYTRCPARVAPGTAILLTCYHAQSCIIIGLLYRSSVLFSFVRRLFLLLRFTECHLFLYTHDGPVRVYVNSVNTDRH